MPTEMIMTETAGTEEAAALSPLPGSPNQNNNGNGEVKPMEVDNPEKDSPPGIPGGGGGAIASGVAGSGTPAAPSPSLLNTPKSAAALDCFKTPEPRTPTSSSKKRKRLTPEEKNLREKERNEKRRKLEEEKQKKEEERLEKARQKEAERLKKEEEKRRSEEEKKREREKKEEERKRIEEEKRIEREKKEEEKKRLEEEKRQERQKKEEERLKKEEERKKKEDERRQELEEKEKKQKKEEEKKEKERKFFTNFFQKTAAPKVKTIEDIVNPAGTGSTINSTAGKSDGAKTLEQVATVNDDSPKKITSLFVPFQIKTDMAVAPLCRRKLTTQDVSVLDAVIQATESCQAGSDSKVNDGKPLTSSASDFLKRIKHGRGRRDEKTVVASKNSEAEIQILDDEVEKPKNVAGYIKWRMKLLQFHDNRRPPYWGTWKRKGKKIKARKPLAQEQDLDYDFDSDDEWEDEPEDAEEIGDSDKDDKDDQPEDGDGEDDEEGWMVPHGYLSDTEREGTAYDIASMKSKEKEFYKSLKDKTSIGWPFIETYDLACYTIRICPVFKSADPVKPVRKRAKPVKKEPVKEPVKEEVKPAEDIILEHAERKSKRSRKVPKNDNPYAKPPSGFLAMNLPSDDEEDMDYDMSDESSSSSSESSGDEEMEEGKENDDNTQDSDDSLNDLFTPIKVTKTKKSPSSS